MFHCPKYKDRCAKWVQKSRRQDRKKMSVIHTKNKQTNDPSKIKITNPCFWSQIQRNQRWRVWPIRPKNVVSNQISASEVRPSVLQNLNVSFLVLKIFSKIILIIVLRFLVTFSVLPDYFSSDRQSPTSVTSVQNSSFLSTNS